MEILQRHYILNFLKLFSIVGIGLSAILTLLNLVRKIDSLLPYDPSAGDIAYYGLLGFPLYFLYLIPVTALVSSLFTLGHASRARETMAVMAAGGRMKRLLTPFVIAGVFLSLLGFVLGEIIVPACSKKAREIKQSLSDDTSLQSLSRDGKLWLRAEDGSLVKIDFYLEDENRFRGMSIFSTKGNTLTKITQAEEADYSQADEVWILRGVRTYLIDEGNVTSSEEMRYPYLGPPDIFKETARKPYEMSFFELRTYLARLKDAGFRNMRLAVEMNAKLSSPFVSLFMVMLGVSLASRRSMGGLIATAVGLLVSLLYWLGFTMMLSLGYAGILSPLLAAWIMPIAFGIVSIYMFVKIKE